jgi:hypothetical protein
MDFSAAITAHLAWKGRLTRCVEGTGEAIDPAVVAAEDQCNLGKWLVEVSTLRPRDAAIAEIRRQHREFHAAAAEVVRCCQCGDREGARARLASGSTFANLSSSLIAKLGAQQKASVAPGPAESRPAPPPTRKPSVTPIRG